MTKGKLTWNSEMHSKYNEITKLMETQIKLSPYDAQKELLLVIDGASSVGTGFVLLQKVKEPNTQAGLLIINAGISYHQTRGSKWQ